MIFPIRTNACPPRLNQNFNTLTQNLRTISLYALAVLIVSGSNFFAVPLLVHLLGPVGFSGWASIEPLLLAAIPLAGLGIQYGLISATQTNPDAPGALLPFQLGTTVLIAIALALLLATLGWPLHVCLLAAGIAGMEGAIAFHVALWRALQHPGRYAFLEGGRALAIVLGLAIAVLALVQATLADYLLLRLTTGAAFLILALVSAGSQWRPDRGAAKRAIAYGLPIVLASVTVAMLMNFDRYAIFVFGTDTTLTTYVAHVKLAQVLLAALAPYFIWLAPIAMRRLAGNIPDQGFFGAGFFAFAAVNLALSLGLWLIAPPLWPLLFPSLTFDPGLFALSLAGIAIFASGNPLSLGSLRDGSTAIALLVTLFAAGTSLVAVSALIPVWGLWGLAAGKSIGFCAYSVVFALHTNRTLRLAYPWRSIALVAGITLALAIILPALTSSLTLPLALSAASGASGFILLVAALIWRFRPQALST